MKIKIGIGYDIHRLVEGRRLILGGIEINYRKGLLGHSDADVLIHAISDSILGALGLPNIGQFFPDTEAETRDLDSKKILEYVRKKLTESNFEISNIDSVIIAQEPKLSGLIDDMRQSLASILRIKADNIGIKATTNEFLGEIGACNAIAAIANTIIFSR